MTPGEIEELRDWFELFDLDATILPDLGSSLGGYVTDADFTPHAGGGTKLSDIARFVGIDRTATSRALRTLENEGLVSRAIGQEDRRTTEVTMTAAGYDRMFQVVPICRENMKHFNAKLTEAERAELKRLLIKLCHGQAGES